MRILFLTPFIPSSERPDALHHLRLLSRHHQVTLIALYRDDAELKDLETIQGWVEQIYALKLSKRVSLQSCALSLFSPRPLYLAYYFDSVLARRMNQIAHKGSFDLVHAHTLRMGLYAAQFDSIPRVMNIQDVLTARYRSYVERSWVSLSWWIDYEEWQKLRRFEPRLCARFNLAGLVSEEESQLLKNLAPNVATCVVRPGVDPSYFAPFPDMERESTIVFLGRFSYRPNVEAALRIAKYIFPRVHRQIPDARLLLVGSQPPAEVKALCSQQRITVTGRVPDVRSYVGRATVSLCPMEIAAGVKHKILQSLALATPVVTNAMGARGIGLTPGQNYLLAEHDESLAEACIGLLRNPAQRKRIGEAGRDHVIKRHSWDKVAESLETFHNLAMANQRLS